MLALHSIASFAGLAFVMALSPGPNLIYLASRSVFQGRQAGFVSLAGTCTAMLLYMLATAIGLSALFKAVPAIYDAIRLAGAAYLLWLALGTWRGSLPFSASSLRRESLAGLYRQGFLTCLLNPKIVLMYGALLPQFIQAESGNIEAQTMILGTVQVLAAAAAHACVIVGAARLGSLLGRSPIFVRTQKYLLSALLAMVAARVALPAMSL